MRRQKASPARAAAAAVGAWLLIVSAALVWWSSLAHILPVAGRAARMAAPAQTSVPETTLGSPLGEPSSTSVPVAEETAKPPDLQQTEREHGVEISGRVLDATGGDVAGASVNVYKLAGEGPGLATESGPAGAFRLWMPPGPCEVRVTAEGYSSASVPVLAPEHDVIVLLTPASSIRGQVLGPSGRPAENAKVIAANQDGPRAAEHSAISGSDGQFALPNLPSGGYLVWAVGTDFQARPRRVNVGVAEDASVILTAEPASLLRASIAAGDAACRSGKALLSGPINLQQSIGSDGSFVFEGLPRGRYALSATCSSTVESGGANPIAELEDVVVIEQPIETRHWSVPLLAADQEEGGQGTIRVIVNSMALNGGPPDIVARRDSGPPFRGETAGDQVLFRDLSLGEYEIFASDMPSVHRRVTLEEPGQSAAVTLVIPSTQTISGIVLDAAGAPVVDAWVAISAAGPWKSDPFGQPVLSDDAGRFTVSDVPRVRLEILATSPVGEARLENVSPGDQHVELRIAAFGAMAGVVEDSKGHRTESFLLSYRRSGDRGYRIVQGYGGKWDLGWIAPGRYDLMVQANGDCGLRHVELLPGRVLDVVLQADTAAARCQLTN